MEIAQLCTSTSVAANHVSLSSEKHVSNMAGRTMIHIYTPEPMSLPSVNLLHLTEFKSLDKILKLMVNTTRSKVKSSSYHDVTHLQPPTNVLTKYQLPKPYGFYDIARTRLYRSRSIQQGQRSNQGHSMMLHIYNP